MAGTTPKYQFPYPTGTDKVADGDNAIQALAERVEYIMGGGIYRSWSMKRGANNGLVEEAWTVSHNLVLTGAGVGTIVAFSSNCVFTSTGPVHVVQQVWAGSSDIATVIPGLAPVTYCEPNGLVTLPLSGIVTVTGSNPIITIEVKATAGGSTQIDQTSHIVGWRIN